jgi:drug/metabolite transporter (DMT)-like permease
MNKKLLYVSLFSLFWAINILLSRYVLLRGINPLVLASSSLFFTVIILLTYFFTTSQKEVFLSSKKSRNGALISGVIGGGLAGLVAGFGLQLSTSINYGFLIKTATAFTIIFAAGFLKEPLPKKKMFFVILMLLGAYLLSTKGQSLTPHIGDIFILLAAASYSGAAVINRSILKKDINPNAVSFYRALMGFIVVAPVAFFSTGSVLSSTILFPIFLVSVSQALLYIYLNKTLAVASASYMTMLSMSVPVLVAIFAIPFFKETMSSIQIVGAILIVAGGILTEKTKIADHE